MMERLLEEVSQMHGIAETDTDMGCSVHAGDRVGRNLSRLQGIQMSQRCNGMGTAAPHIHCNSSAKNN